jgi:hypothetical protein
MKREYGRRDAKSAKQRGSILLFLLPSRAADVCFFVFAGGFLEDVDRFFRVGDFEDAGGAAAWGAAGAVGVVDVDVMFAQDGGDVA